MKTTSSPSAPSGLVLHVSHPAFWALAILLAAPWAALGIAWFRSGERAAPSGNPVPQRSIAGPARNEPTEAPQVKYCRQGPWGDLEYTPILIEPPEEFVGLDIPPATAVQWLFTGHDYPRLTELWQAAGLTPNQIAQLDKATLSDGANCLVTAHRDFIFSLSPAARGKIYSALAQFPENKLQIDPFRFRSDSEEDWLHNSRLSGATVDLVKRLFYRRGTSVLFSDHPFVMPLLNSDGERLRLIKTLSRKSTMLLKLRVTQDSDIDALARYWSHTRAKDIRPLLQSIADLPGGGSLDIVHLLPRGVRVLLYTYPVPPFEADAAGRDCHWTSLNFFRDEPDDECLKPDKVRSTLLEQYYPVAGEPHFGDLFMLVREDNTAVHSCVYIADDIVFTKNGAGSTMPWILMTMSDLQAFYPEDPPLRTLRYRLKNR